MMATVPHVTSGSGLRNPMPMDFCSTGCTYQDGLNQTLCIHFGSVWWKTIIESHRRDTSIDKVQSNTPFNICIARTFFYI